MKRLKVRWHTAMNGREAVTKWRAGGFHLVLMDIQLPVMNGLEATKEIRRLERVNNIGVFSNNASNAPPLHNMDRTDEGNGGPEGGPEGEDRLLNTGLFKSPVIIVALTASSLQSDRHEALAAGCNDFLTKVRLWMSFFLLDRCQLQLALQTADGSVSQLTSFTLTIFPLTNGFSCLLLAGQLRLARTQSNGMGLHASLDRFRRLAQMERLFTNAGFDDEQQ